MKMNKYSDYKIIESWRNNVNPWISAIRNNEIESRLLITNSAIINVIIECNPKTVLDTGCGEGWLVRELEKLGILSLGIDIVQQFIDSALEEGAGRFKAISYENLSYRTLKETFDVVVCNFSLLGKESVIGLFKNMPSLINENGLFIIQTIHPVVCCGDRKYEDGWREGSWDGFSDKFKDPAPWYFRTLETWKLLFLNNGFTINKIIEPLNQKTQAPASIIFVGTAKKIKSTLNSNIMPKK